jgi:hypothetical protein
VDKVILVVEARKWRVLEKPELSKLQVDMARAINPNSTMASLSSEDMTVRNYLVLLYGLFERTHPSIGESGLTVTPGISGRLS